MFEEEVILVNEKDEELGRMEKLEAHRKGLLHRAISVLVLNSTGHLLLQQRAKSKYHSAGLWSNTCCSHPRPGEKNKTAAERRLFEEMGLRVGLQHRDEFIYHIGLEKGLSEHEYDHVFLGTCDQNPLINAEEVQAFRWIHSQELLVDLKNNPGKYTYWFFLLINRLVEKKVITV